MTTLGKAWRENKQEREPPRASPSLSFHATPKLKSAGLRAKSAEIEAMACPRSWQSAIETMWGTLGKVWAHISKKMKLLKNAHL